MRCIRRGCRQCAILLCFPCSSYGPAITTPTLRRSAYATSEANRPGSALGCNAADFAGFTAGNVALMDRGTCNFTARLKNAQNAGASAAIVVNVVDNIPSTLGGTDPYNHDLHHVPVLDRIRPQSLETNPFTGTAKASLIQNGAPNSADILAKLFLARSAAEKS